MKFTPLLYAYAENYIAGERLYFRAHTKRATRFEAARLILNKIVVDFTY